MKPKHLLFSLILLLLILLCGCARSAPPEPSPEPTPTATPEPTPPPVDYSGLLRISEIGVKNRASFYLDGFPDWVELENISDKTLALEGWTLSDRPGRGGLALTGELEPGALLLLPLDGADFFLSLGETLWLRAPDDGVQDRALLSADTADCSLQRQADGSFRESPWISPGYPNDAEGHERFCAGRVPEGPLILSEIMVANHSYPLHSQTPAFDWVEIRNISDETVDLSEFCLSDDGDRLDKWRFPSRSLKPGELYLVICDGDLSPDDKTYREPSTGFSLDSRSDQLYLSRTDGTLLDFAALHDIPEDRTLGREEGRPGLLYYAVPSPREKNSGGQRRVSAMPESLEADGVFDGVESVAVTLAAAGEIRYTLDGSVPTAESALYTGALTLEKTTLLRAVAVEEDAIPSPVRDLSYILNEGHVLPVLSMVVNDWRHFRTTYEWGDKYTAYSGSLTLFDGEHSFSHPCSVSLRGWTSLNLQKKSFGVRFRTRDGGDLEADVFSNGITRFHSLAVRAGQDYLFSIFRNELMQDLCLEAGNDVLAQASKYCILYLNGQYWGIYCLKEDITRSFYASHRGVSKDSVESIRGIVPGREDLYKNVIEFAWFHELSEEENYRQICENVDIRSLCDWFLFESYCSNTDTEGNIRFMRSTENDHLWDLVFYDLDWSFRDTNAFSVLLARNGHPGPQIPPLLINLCKNAEFRDMVLRRWAELTGGVLSDEHVLAKIDEFETLLAPEVPRDWKRWGLEPDRWLRRVEELRVFVRDNGWARKSTDELCRYLRVSAEERMAYFGY